MLGHDSLSFSLTRVFVPETGCEHTEDTNAQCGTRQVLLQLHDPQRLLQVYGAPLELPIDEPLHAARYIAIATANARQVWPTPPNAYEKAVKHDSCTRLPRREPLHAPHTPFSQQALCGLRRLMKKGSDERGDPATHPHGHTDGEDYTCESAEQHHASARTIERQDSSNMYAMASHKLRQANLNVASGARLPSRSRYCGLPMCDPPSRIKPAAIKRHRSSRVPVLRSWSPCIPSRHASERRLAMCKPSKHCNPTIWPYGRYKPAPTSSEPTT